MILEWKRTSEIQASELEIIKTALLILKPILEEKYSLKINEFPLKRIARIGGGFAIDFYISKEIVSIAEALLGEDSDLVCGIWTDGNRIYLYISGGLDYPYTYGIWEVEKNTELNLIRWGEDEETHWETSYARYFLPAILPNYFVDEDVTQEVEV